MERRTTVRYKPASGASDSDQRRSASYDRDTGDTNLFALGEAAQDGGMAELDLDSIFKDFGFSFGDPFGPNNDQNAELPMQSGDTQVSRSTHQIPGGGNQQNIQVSTIKKTLPDGKTVETRIMRGPVQTKKRIIKVNRELPGGGTEVLGEFEAPADQSMDHFLPTAVSTALSRSMQKITDLESGNTPSEQAVEQKSDSDLPTGSTTNYSLPTPVNNFPTSKSADEIYKQGRDSTSSTYDNDKLITSPQGLDERFKLPKPKTYTLPKYSRIADLVPQVMNEENKDSGGKGDDANDLPSVSPSPLRRKPALKARLTYPDPDSIQDNYDLEAGYRDGEKEARESMCPLCCPKFWTRKRGAKRSKTEIHHGKGCMTQTEVDSNGKTLPSFHSLVANYAKMLHEDKARFVHTLFRAVKLDNLDVLRILIRISQKSGFKLSGHHLREPESSATIFHVALLYSHEDIVNFLLDLGDSELVMAKYESLEYRNQTGLHVAIANGVPEMVEKVLLSLDPVERQELINTQATGNYFKKQHPHGQLCLTAATWAGNGDIIKLLVSYGGNLTLKNSNGNTIIHSVILQSSSHPGRRNYEQILKSIWEATRIWAEQMTYDSKFAQQIALEQSEMQVNLFKDLMAIRNNDGYTPITLATVTNSSLFPFLINFDKIYKIPQNKLGSITWMTYDVTDITSFAYLTYNKFSVLHILAHNSQQLARRTNVENIEVDFLEMEPIKALIACKWGVYRFIYISWMIIHFSYMVIFTACTAAVNTSNSYQNVSGSEKLKIRSDKVEYGYAFFIILPFIYALLELLDLFGNKPYRMQFMSGYNYILRLMKTVQSESSITGNGPYRMVNIGFTFFTVYWFFLYISEDANQDVALAMALLLGWIFVLFFTRGCRVTCRFTIMIQKMFFRDLTYFLTVYGIILVAFSFSMNSLFTVYREANINVSKVFYDMLNVVTDLDKKQAIGSARHPLFARLLLIFYAIVAVILLMNMLIAMMNTSYETIRMTKCNLWKQQQLSILLMLERRLFWWKWLCKRSERDIWRRADEEELRCLMDVTVLHTDSYFGEETKMEM